MSGTIHSKPLTKEYVEGWEHAHRGDAVREERKVREHDCEHCGKHMKYDDQSCACTARSLW